MKTNFDRVKAEVGAYEVSRNAVESAIEKVAERYALPSFLADSEYVPGTLKYVAIAAIYVLNGVRGYKSVREGDVSKEWNDQEIDGRIRVICQENGLSPDRFLTEKNTVNNLTNRW
ncbi:MAG: hypothetical protein PHS63_05125 [Desulfoplanes sp.]|nr:hypothetical protein [Desulfoplanes sp.]MDD4032671.1 hypothetical protein [Bacteroidales bacterium]